MPEFVRIRAGLPRLAARLHAGQPCTIVAFGTSLTLGGQYLAGLLPALREAYGSVPIRLINRGRDGYNTHAATFRFAEDVLAAAPDLVLLEFAHNDVVDYLVEQIPGALDGMVAQLQSALPAAEIAFVELGLRTRVVDGRTPAIDAYEAAAERYGFPSINLGALAADLVATGRASWNGDGAPALTVDGIHHAPPAAELLGGPFAAAVRDVLAASGSAAGPAPAVPASDLATVARLPATAIPRGGPWAARPLRADEQRGPGIDEEGLLEALAPGAVVRFALVGTQLFAWARGTGTLGVVVEPGGGRFRVPVYSDAAWQWVVLSPPLARARYDVEVIALDAGLMLGDVALAGSPAL